MCNFKLYYVCSMLYVVVFKNVVVYFPTTKC